MISHEEAVIQSQETMVSEIMAYVEENHVDGYLHLNDTPFPILDKVVTTMGYVSCGFIKKHLWGNGLIINAGEETLDIDILPDNEIGFYLYHVDNAIYYSSTLSIHQLYDIKDGEVQKPDDLRERIVDMLKLCDAINLHYVDGVDKILAGTDELFA